MNAKPKKATLRELFADATVRKAWALGLEAAKGLTPFTGYTPEQSYIISTRKIAHLFYQMSRSCDFFDFTPLDLAHLLAATAIEGKSPEEVEKLLGPAMGDHIRQIQKLFITKSSAANDSLLNLVCTVVDNHVARERELAIQTAAFDQLPKAPLKFRH